MADIPEFERQAQRESTFNRNAGDAAASAGGMAGTALRALKATPLGSIPSYIMDSVDAVRGAAVDGLAPAAGVAVRRAAGLPLAPAYGLAQEAERVLPAVKDAAGQFASGVLTGEASKPATATPSDWNQRAADQSYAGAPGMSGSPKAAPVASYKPEPDVTSTFTAYASKNPASAFDDDIRLMHNMARVYSLVPGFEQKAKMYRDTYSQLNGERIKEVSDNAQRAFAAGDITAGIDAFNHVVPNGRKITGYRQNPDKTYTFKFADGTEDTRSPEQVAGTIATMGNPGLVAAMMQTRAKAGAELGKDLAVAQVKHQYSLIQAQQQGLIDVQKSAYLEQLKAQLDPKGHVTVGMDGTPYINTRDGVYKVEDRPNPLDPKQRVPTPVKVMGLGPQQGQQSGYAFNPGAITGGRIQQALGR